MSGETYRLQVEALDLGPDSKAVGLELIDLATGEPLAGPDAARIWAAILPALAGTEPWALDFFAHTERVREFCRSHGIALREPNPHAVVVPAPSPEHLAALLERFAGETFGARAQAPEGGRLPDAEACLAGQLAARGIDAYQAVYPGTLFCAVCDFEGGFLTLLSEKLWASEVIRRVRPALAGLSVEVTRPA
jgi:hypothetical protein